jgi:nitroreductase
MRAMATESEQLLTLLRARRSVPALQLQPPGPSAAEVEAALDTALRAPDHGALRPWRFILIRDEAARARLADLFTRRMLERSPPAPPHKIEKARIMPRTAPLVIAVGARVLREHKIPEIEQLLSSGAAVMNLLNAFHIQGYGAILLTGDNAYDPVIAAELGFAPDERCLGFVYVGSLPAQLQLPAPARVPRDSCVREWGG